MALSLLDSKAQARVASQPRKRTCRKLGKFCSNRTLVFDQRWRRQQTITIEPTSVKYKRLILFSAIPITGRLCEEHRHAIE
jgi:hypothetical protein